MNISIESFTNELNKVLSVENDKYTPENVLLFIFNSAYENTIKLVCSNTVIPDNEIYVAIEYDRKSFLDNPRLLNDMDVVNKLYNNVIYRIPSNNIKSCD